MAWQTCIQSDQARYVLRDPWKGDETSCPAADDYRREVLRRQENEARQLAELTGGDLTGIRAQMNLRTSTARGGAVAKPVAKLTSRVELRQASHLHAVLRARLILA